MKHKNLSKLFTFVMLISLLLLNTVFTAASSSYYSNSLSTNRVINVNDHANINQYSVNENGQTYGNDIYTNPASQSPDLMAAYGLDETYGSGLYSDVLGQEPDLISAYGIDGTFGYVRAKDLDSNPNTPEKAIEQQNMNKGSRKIALYDKDGKTVIGVFEIEQAEAQLLGETVK